MVIAHHGEANKCVMLIFFMWHHFSIACFEIVIPTSKFEYSAHVSAFHISFTIYFVYGSYIDIDYVKIIQLCLFASSALIITS